MGTTRAFFNIVNTGLSKEELIQALSEMSSGQTLSLTPEISQMYRKLGGSDESLALLKHLIKTNNVSNEDSIIAYCETAKMFPFYDTERCEGCTASSIDNDILAQYFKAPILSFSVMDSDILFVSYRDREAEVGIDCVKPNCPDMEEYDMSLYKQQFPDFLLEYCDMADRQKLRDVWESEEYVFADDRMRDICKLIGAEVLYDYDCIPENFEVLSAADLQ